MSVYKDSSLLSKLCWDASGFKTMSDSIKSILEQGILLEQALINHKNRILEKKANKANFNKEANESFMSESSKCSEENRLNDKSVNNMVQNSINEMDKSETESHTSNSDSVCTNKVLEGLVKLVDPTQLLDLKVNSAVSVNRVTQFVTASSNALKNSLLSADDNLIQSEPSTSCVDGAMTSDLAEGDLQESEGTNLSNVDTYSNIVTQDNRNTLLPNSTQNKNSPNILLPFNLASIKREDDLPVMPSPIVVKNEHKQEDNGLVRPCLQLNITNHSSDNVDIDNIRSTDSNGLDSEAVISAAVLDNMDLTKTTPPNSLYISCHTKLTENIVLKFFNSRGIEIVQFKRFNSNTFSSGIVLLKNGNDVKRALKLNKKFLINGTFLCIKRYYSPKVQIESRCKKGRNTQKQINAARSKKNTNNKKTFSGASKKNSTKKQLMTINKCKNNIDKGQISNFCVSQNMLNPSNLPETNTAPSTEFAKESVCSQQMDQNISSQSDTMQNVKQVEIHPNKECIDYRYQSNSDSSYMRRRENRNVNRQHQQSNNDQFLNNRDARYEKFKRDLARKSSYHRFDNRQNQRRGTNQHYYSNSDTCQQ